MFASAGPAPAEPGVLGGSPGDQRHHLRRAAFPAGRNEILVAVVSPGLPSVRHLVNGKVGPVRMRNSFWGRFPEVLVGALLSYFLVVHLLIGVCNYC